MPDRGPPLGFSQIMEKCYSGYYLSRNARRWAPFKFLSGDSIMARANVSGEPLATTAETKRSILMTAFAALTLMTYGNSGIAADVQRGKQFAGRVCIICHVVFKGQAPGDPKAPSFQSIAKSRQFRKKGVRLIWETHPTMPNFALTQEESTTSLPISSHLPNSFCWSSAACTPWVVP